MGDGLAESLEDRQRGVEIGLLPADHDRERSLDGALLPSRHRRIQHPHALGLERLAHLLRHEG